MKTRTEFMVGAVILLGVALVVFGIMWLQGFAFGEERIPLRARFEAVGQLQTGNPVTLRGVQVGEVTGIEFAPGGNAVIVAMRIDNAVPLPEDPVVLLASASLFGGWQAKIVPREAYERYDFTEAPDPTVLPGATSPSITQLAAVADRIAQNLAVLTERVQLAFTEETALNIRRAVENVTEVSERLADIVGAQQRALEKVTASVDTTVARLNRLLRLARETLAQVNTALDAGELEAIVNNLQSTTARSDSLTIELLMASRELHSILVSADSTLEELETITSNIEQGRGTLGALVNDSTLYQQLVETNRVLQLLLLDLRENPERYINLRVF